MEKYNIGHERTLSNSKMAFVTERSNKYKIGNGAPNEMINQKLPSLHTRKSISQRYDNGRPNKLNDIRKSYKTELWDASPKIDCAFDTSKPHRRGCWDRRTHFNDDRRNSRIRQLSINLENSRSESAFSARKSHEEGYDWRIKQRKSIIEHIKSKDSKLGSRGLTYGSSSKLEPDQNMNRNMDPEDRYLDRHFQDLDRRNLYRKDPDRDLDQVETNYRTLDRGREWGQMDDRNQVYRDLDLVDWYQGEEDRLDQENRNLDRGNFSRFGLAKSIGYGARLGSTINMGLGLMVSIVTGGSKSSGSRYVSGGSKSSVSRFGSGGLESRRIGSMGSTRSELKPRLFDYSDRRDKIIGITPYVVDTMGEGFVNEGNSRVSRSSRLVDRKRIACSGILILHLYNGSTIEM